MFEDLVDVYKEQAKKNYCGGQADLFVVEAMMSCRNAVRLCWQSVKYVTCQSWFH